MAVSILPCHIYLRMGRCGHAKRRLGWPSSPRPASHGPTPHGKNAWREEEPMDALTEHEMEVIVQRLETLVTDLEHDLSTPTFYAFVLLAQEFAGTKNAPYTLTHIRRCLVLAH